MGTRERIQAILNSADGGYVDRGLKICLIRAIMKVVSEGTVPRVVYENLLSNFETYRREAEERCNALIEDLSSKRKFVDEMETFLEKIGHLDDWRGY